MKTIHTLIIEVEKTGQGWLAWNYATRREAIKPTEAEAVREVGACLAREVEFVREAPGVWIAKAEY